jgi:dolichyl-phosphate-mannose-protein mannosyltransferase
VNVSLSIAKSSDDRVRIRAFLLLAGAVALVHLPMLALLPVSGDEAYYWQCARHPDWSYFDQPPLMIALMGISTRLLGINEVGARLPAVAVGLALSIILLWIGRRLFGDTRASLWALIGLLATPLFALGTIYSSTDVLLCLFVLAVPPLAALAILEDRPRLWLLVGFLGGLGGLAKFSMVLCVPAVLTLILLDRRGRRHLNRPEPYLGVLLGALAASPALLWAILHHFDNIAFQLVDRHDPSPSPLLWLGEYWGSQFLLVTPLLFPLFLAGVVAESRRALRERDLATLALTLPAGLYLAFFGLTALRTSSAPHWSAPAYLVAAVPSARWVLRRWSGWGTFRRGYVFAGLAVGFAFTLGAHALLFFHSSIPAGWSYNHRVSTDALRNVRGWRELAAHLRSLEGAEFDPDRDAIVCDSYTTASLIAFYSGGRYDPLLMASAAGKHGLAYLYWQRPLDYAGRAGIYVGDWRKEATREAFEAAYGTTTDLGRFKIVTRDLAGRLTEASQTWRILRGERLTSNPDLLRPFAPEGRRRSNISR